MSTVTLLRPPGTAGTATGSSRPLRTAVVGLVAAGVVAGGTWGLMAPRESGDGHPAGHAAAAVGTVDLSDGTLRVDGLVDKQVGQAMADMSMAEDVPAGMRRFSVDVSLGATDGKALAYSRRDFTVSGAGVKPVVPVDGQIDRGTLTPGMAVSGSLTFDVPKETTALSLRFRDTDPVTLPALPPVAEGEHDAGQAPVTAPAGAPAPAADRHDAPGAPAHDR